MGACGFTLTEATRASQSRMCACLLWPRSTSSPGPASRSRFILDSFVLAAGGQLKCPSLLTLMPLVHDFFSGLWPSVQMPPPFHRRPPLRSRRWQPSFPALLLLVRLPRPEAQQRTLACAQPRRTDLAPMAAVRPASRTPTARQAITATSTPVAKPAVATAAASSAFAFSQDATPAVGPATHTADALHPRPLMPAPFLAPCAPPAKPFKAAEAPAGPALASTCRRRHRPVRRPPPRRLRCVSV